MLSWDRPQRSLQILSATPFGQHALNVCSIAPRAAAMSSGASAAMSSEANDNPFTPVRCHMICVSSPFSEVSVLMCGKSYAQNGTYSANFLDLFDGSAGFTSRLSIAS